MSSWKRAAKANQKTHRERHQPESRQHLGLLEKKKDYTARARDYHEKQSTIKLLRKRALNKNPDEFYFHMINSKLANGVHKEKKKSVKHTPDQLKLMDTQDLKYISHKRTVEAKKIEKLQSQMHMIDAANTTRNQHMFFVDEDSEVKKFDVARRLDTHPSLLDRRTNRPRLSNLKKMKLPDLDERTLKKMEQQKHMAYKELNKRIDRERELTIVQQKVEIKRALKDKKVSAPKKIKPATMGAPPIYQWKFERKR